MVQPKGASGCVVVFHEVWGLTEHTRDVCKRLGKLGFAAAAPNLYKGHDTLLTPGNVQKAMEVVWDLSLEERRAKPKIDAAVAEKKPTDEVAEAIAKLYDQGFRDEILSAAVGLVEDMHIRFGGASTLGFSFGGGISFRVATKTKKLNSAISYCGEPPDDIDISRLSSPVLAVYGGKDGFMNKHIPRLSKAAAMAGTDLTLRVLPGAEHGFFDDTRPAYNREAAKEAWDLTAWFLDRTLGRARAA